jgi:hypothetical protein
MSTKLLEETMRNATTGSLEDAPSFPTTSWIELSTLLEKVGERLSGSGGIGRIVIERKHARDGEPSNTVRVRSHWMYEDFSVLRATLLPEGEQDASPHVQ